MRAWKSLSIVLSALALMIGTVVTPASADVIIIGNDSAPPTIVSTSLGVTSADVSLAATDVGVTAHVTDDLSGVTYVSTSLRNNAANVVYQNVLALTAGTKLDGTWTGTITLPRHAPTGTYTLGCYATDTVGRTTFCPTTTDTIEVAGGDAAAPTIDSISTPPGPFDVTSVPADVAITAHVTDDLSGVTYVSTSLRNNAANVVYQNVLRLTAGTKLDGTWTGTITLPRHAPSGTYTLGCYATDTVGRTTFCPTSTDTIEVAGGDAAAPTIHSISTPPGPFDVTSVPADVAITAHVTDDLSGVTYVSTSLRNNAANVVYQNVLALTAGTKLDGTWTGTITLPRHAPTGTYTLGCYATDTVGRTTFCPTTTDTIVVVDHSVDLVTDLTAPVTTVAAGQAFALTATISNGGAAAPTSPRLVFDVPALTTLGALPAGCTLDSPSREVRCDLPAGSLAPGTTVARSFSLSVSPVATGALTSTATASSASVERNATNNRDSLTVTVTAPPPVEPPPTSSPARLSLTKNADQAAVVQGDTVTYTLTATNAAGGGVAKDVQIKDSLPAGLTFVSADAGCTNVGRAVTCALGDLAPGATRAVHVRASVDAIPMRMDPNTAHLLDEQKQETFLGLPAGATSTASVSCPSGMYATSGGVRIDAVDQGRGRLSDVHVLASGPSGTGGWSAKVHNATTGQAQTKVYVSCLSSATISGPHQHALTSTTASPQTVTLTPDTRTVDVACPAGNLPIAPSYDVTNGATTILGSARNGTGWRFTVAATDGREATFGVRCLATRTSAANGHTHDLATSQLTETVTVAAHSIAQRSVTCPGEAKGVATSVTTEPGLTDLGTDPQAKTRLFRFSNETSGPLTATVGLTCVDVRTSGEPVSIPLTNRATITTTSTDTTTADDVASATVTAYGEGFAILPTPTASLQRAGNLARVRAGIRCATACTVTSTLTALTRVRGTAIRAGRVLAAGTGRYSSGTQVVTLTAGRPYTRPLVTGQITRARLTVTTTDGARYTRVITLRR